VTHGESDGRGRGWGGRFSCGAATALSPCAPCNPSPRFTLSADDPLAPGHKFGFWGPHAGPCLESTEAAVRFADGLTEQSLRATDALVLSTDSSLLDVTPTVTSVANEGLSGRIAGTGGKESLTEALKRLNAERREKEAAVAALGRASADLARERDRSRKNIISRLQAEKRALVLQEELDAAQGVAEAAASKAAAAAAAAEAKAAALVAELAEGKAREEALAAERDAALAAGAALQARVVDLQGAVTAAEAGTAALRRELDSTQGALAKETLLRLSLERELAATEAAHAVKYEELAASVRTLWQANEVWAGQMGGGGGGCVYPLGV
jgi:hypothetical protein